MAKDAKKTLKQGSTETESEPQDLSQQPASPKQAAPGKRQQPAIQSSTLINIAAHSLLMVTVPFALFFASLLGALDPLYELTGSKVPRQEVKSYIGAGLAVLGVNLVICSFIVRAFKEDVEPVKED